MPETQLADNAPGAALFPQFESRIYDMFAAEVAGLTDAQLDFESDRWEWSIRRNVSHVTSGDLRWLLLRWGEPRQPGLARRPAAERGQILGHG